MKKIEKELYPIYGIDSDEYGLILDSSNRKVDSKQVKKLVKAMMNKEEIDPIFVDAETLIIVDGQHRYEAAKLLWKAGNKFTLPVQLRNYEGRYGIVHGMMICNNGRKNWGVPEFLHCWANEGKEDYITLLGTFDEHKKYLKNRYKVLVTLLSLNGGNDDYREGDFKIGDFTKNMEVLDELEQVSDALGNGNIFKPTIVQLYSKNLDTWKISNPDSDRQEVLNKARLTLANIDTPPDTRKEWTKVFEEANLFPDSLD